jgi:hypothetical protein
MFSAAFSRRASAAASFAPSRLPLPSKLPDECRPLLSADACAQQNCTQNRNDACGNILTEHTAGVQLKQSGR